uniref:Uncharacterized protein n=1 Tax=Aegilops tauschii subsp. strangulata TaxID=200361 RepID=A0A453KKT0_AEGTS
MCSRYCPFIYGNDCSSPLPFHLRTTSTLGKICASDVPFLWSIYTPTKNRSRRPTEIL